MHTDRDGDDLADHVLRIGPDGGVREVGTRSAGLRDAPDPGVEP